MLTEDHTTVPSNGLTRLDVDANQAIRSENGVLQHESPSKPPVGVHFSDTTQNGHFSGPTTSLAAEPRITNGALLDGNAIAIVGIGLRLPGNIHNTEAFWDLIVNKRETRGRVPESRYNVEGFYHFEKEAGSIAAKYGHFLADTDRLDAMDTSFFTISKAEADQLDPQQRMLLEVVWECMENGGQVDWRGQNIGVFLGTFNEDWNDLLMKDLQTTGLHKIVSMMDFVVANRISYEYNLKGPS
jgi:acyl transferase domain-containing protein